MPKLMKNSELDELEQRALLIPGTTVSGDQLNQLIELARYATGRTHKENCAYCLRPAVRLCDWLWRGSDGFLDPRNAETCDKPLCLEHAQTHDGIVFLCGPNGCETDTYDFCVEHEQIYETTGEVFSFKEP